MKMTILYIEDNYFYCLVVHATICSRYKQREQPLKEKNNNSMCEVLNYVPVNLII